MKGVNDNDNDDEDDDDDANDHRQHLVSTLLSQTSQKSAAS